MVPAGRTGGVGGWFVRRAGLARFTTLGLAFGVSLTALTGARLLVAAAGLGAALLFLVGHLGPRHRGVEKTRPTLLAVASTILMGVFSGYLLGGVRVLTLSGSELAPHFGSRVAAKVTVVGSVRSSSSGRWLSATAVVNAISIEHQAGAGRAVIPLPSAQGETVLLEVESVGDDPASLAQGQVVVLTGIVSEPQGESASGFNQRSYLRHQGIEVVLAVKSLSMKVLGFRSGVSGWFDRLRESSRAHLSRGPDDGLDELLQGIVMGDTAGIDEGWAESFRRSGTAHMLSVSGLHVASLAAIMIGLAKLARAPRAAGFLLAAAASCLMIPFVGGSPPVVRSVAMIVIVLMGRWVGRRRDQWQILGLAAAVVLSLNPYALFDVGFQLSFAAFAGMLVLVAPLQKTLGFLPQGVRANVAVSIAASAGTAPVSLAVFGRTSLVAVFANLVVVPLLPVITGLGMASIAAGFIWPGLSTALDFVVSPAMAWTVQASRLFASAPVLESSQVARSCAAITAAVLAVPAAFALAGRILPAPLGLPLPYFRRASRWLYVRRPRRRGATVVLVAALVVSFLVTGWAAYPTVQRGAFRVAAAGYSAWPDSLEVRVLDIGQGNAVLMRTPDHRAFLFDGGPAGCGLGGQLRSLGVTTLDLVVISHPHADHFAGLLECLGSVSVKALVDRTTIAAPQAGSASAMANRGQEARDYLDFRSRLDDDGCRHLLAHTGLAIKSGGVTIQIYSPERPLPMVDGGNPWALRPVPPSGDELNAGSVVALVSWGNADFLLPGDAEAGALAEYNLPSAEVLVVPHHGSAGGVSPEILQELKPEVAVISVGEGNTFGHPDASTVRLLEATVPTVVRTDEAGWVCFDMQEDAIRVSTERRAGP